MNGNIETLFTQALGLSAPWVVKDVKLDTQAQRIDFEIACQDARLTCPACGAEHQSVHDRLLRSWRHLDFFQYEAWLHCRVPRVVCSGCGKTTQVSVPWARPGSGFTAMFEALALTLCHDLPVRQVAKLLRCEDKQLWRRIEHYVGEARDREIFKDVQTIGIDETSLHRGQSYITVVHDLQAKRLLFATEGREHQTILDFVEDLKAHGGDPADVRHVCVDMSAAYTKGVGLALPDAEISFDRFHVIQLALEAMDEVRREEVRENGDHLREQLGGRSKVVRDLMWGMRRNPRGWKKGQTHAMHCLQRSNLKSARAWRLKMALQEVYAQAAASNDQTLATELLTRWISWARRCRLVSFKKLGATLRDRHSAVVRGMLDNRSNAYVEAMNGQLQLAKRAARGFRTAKNFIAIAYLRLSKLTHLPQSPLRPAAR